MAIKLESGFEILRFSDLDYDQMTAEIQFKGEQIAQINMDNGFENLEVEVFTEFADPQFVPKFKVDDLIEAVNESKKILREYVKDSNRPTS
jgi:hypothetical protein